MNAKPGARHARIQTLTRCARTLAHITDRDEILAYAATAALTLVDASEARVYFEAGGNTLCAKTVAGRSATLESLNRALSEVIAETTRDESRAALFAPMHANGAVVGAIAVHFPAAFQIEPDVEWCLDALADHAASAIAQGECAQDENESLRRAMAEALNDTTKHPEIMSALSHEARSPLLVLDLACDALGETLPEATAEQLDLLAQLRAARQRLQLLVENLVELRRMELGLLTIRPKPILLRTAIDAAAEVVAPNFAAKRQRLIIECGPTERIVGDTNRVRHILQNVLANAGKFSPLDSEIKVIATRDDTGLVHVDVIDQGPGIEPDQRDVIFLPYQGSPGPHSSNHVGLGLTVARELARRMGGDIAVTTPPNGPTRFTLQLPSAHTP